MRKLDPAVGLLFVSINATFVGMALHPALGTLALLINLMYLDGESTPTGRWGAVLAAGVGGIGLYSTIAVCGWWTIPLAVAAFAIGAISAVGGDKQPA